MRHFLRSFLTLAVGVPVTSIPSPTYTEVDGALVPAGSLLGALGSIINSSVAGDSAPFTTASGTTATITALQNAVFRYTAGSATTVTIDSAYNIVRQMQNPYLGQTFPFVIITNASTTIATPTLSDTAVTLSGTTSVLGAAARWYQGQITQMSTTVGSTLTAGTTWTSLTQVGSTNNYTVALGTNAISPTVGNAIYLGVTGGTLPAGWYPINKVTSATSFVIAAPVSGSAWTATAVTLPGTATVPTSAYTPGLPGLFSPLLTITGMMATVTATMSV